MNMTFKIDIDRKKIEAIRCYLPDGNVEQLLHEEITKAANSAIDLSLIHISEPTRPWLLQECY